MRRRGWSGCVGSTAIALALVLVAGCGAGRDDGAERATPTSSTATTPTTDATSSTSSPTDPTEPVEELPVEEVPGGTSTETLTLDDGTERTYRVHVPDGLPAGEPVPLLLALHGGGGSAEQFARNSGFDAVADREGFIVAYPDGSGAIRTWNGGYCCGAADRDDIDDVAFLRALVDELREAYPVDPDRVFAAGHSNGGIMSYRLACEAADVFAAIGVVAGSVGIESCAPSSPVSVVHIHGDQDQNHPIDGGVGPNGVSGVSFRSAGSSVEEWAGLDGCDPRATTSTEGAVSTQEWSGCDGGTDVVFHTISGASHAYPGHPATAPSLTGEASTAMDASEVIWTFLSTHGR
jgi:polyhydroxybutyrate depolymerase